MRTFILYLVFGCLLFTNVWADHEPDHRYNILGYVLDANQEGIDDLTMQAIVGGKILGTGKTNADGYYSLHLHLHNEDYNRVLELIAGPYKAKTRVTFDVGDDSTARVHEANFVNGKFVDGSLGHFRIPSWSYVIGSLLLIIVIAIYLEKRRKKKIRLAKYNKTKKSSPARHKAKKGRRKKH
jgi:hypothetical protein